MVAIIHCDEEEAEFLRWRRSRPEDLERGWETTRSAAVWKGTHIALIVTEDKPQNPAIAYVGRVSVGRQHGTLERDLTVTQVHALEWPVPLDELAQALPSRVRALAYKAEPLPKRSGEILLDVLTGLRPELTLVLESLQQRKPPIVVRSAAARLLAFERDAIGVALQMADFDRSLLEEAQLPETLDGPLGSFLNYMPVDGAHEDELINHDAARFLDWMGEDTNHRGWRVYAKGKQRLFIGNVNRKPAEETLGVDLIYYHVQRQSFVLVQYKEITPDGNDWSYYPSTDRDLDSQLQRMHAVDEACRKSIKKPNDYRLSETPCWLKLCRANGYIPRTSELILGMYLPHDFFRQLRGEDIGWFGYKTVPRYLDNTAFTQLVCDGWIGSAGTGDDLVREQIDASQAWGRDLIFAVLLGESPFKGERIKQRLVRFF
ncbi:hypothetical protein [Carbonactinospora thermoautotrophica]|uniref:hypothetical protein n=1 Tax=Carbonactinospora thermoautotrophica TaxID=1469144 RepID=UPI0008335A1B|nr:hypothetical protein [Carbonactinospora thermoautotrophica]